MGCQRCFLALPQSVLFFLIIINITPVLAKQIPGSTTEEPSFSTDIYDIDLIQQNNLTTTGALHEGHGSQSALKSTAEVSTESGPDEHALKLLRISDEMYKYGMTCVFVFGAIGNALVLVVLAKGSSGGSTSTMYLFALGIMDQMVIFFAVFGSHVIRSFTGFDYIRWHRTTCKIAYFIIVSCSQTSFYLVAAMSLERALVMWKPLKFLHVFTRRRVGFAIGMILMAFIIKNSLMFWTQGAVYETVGNETVVVSECGIPEGPLYHYAVEVRPWLDYVLTFLAASIIMLANLVIITAVCRSSRLQKKSATYNANIQAHQMVAMLVAVSLTFLVLALPLQIVTILVPHNPNDVQNESEAYAKLMWSLGLLLSYANHGVNFYVYCLSGRTFREDLFQVLCCGRMKTSKYSSSLGSSTRGTVVTADEKYVTNHMHSITSTLENKTENSLENSPEDTYTAAP